MSVTIKEFIEEILQTGISDATIWLESLQKSFPKKMWDTFLSIPATVESVESMAAGIAIQISKYVKQMPKELIKDKLGEGHRFLVEMHRIAKKHGIETDLKKIDWIFVPGMERVADILTRAGY